MDYSLADACKILGLTRQAVYISIKNGKMHTTRVKGRHRISDEDISAWRKEKYSRAKYYGNGYISARQASEQTGEDIQRIYYLIYFHILPAEQRGAMWFIKQEDLDACDVRQRIRRGFRRK